MKPLNRSRCEPMGESQWIARYRYGKGGSGVLEDRRHALRARGVVGVLAAQGCCLEILPKIDVVAEGGVDRQNATIRKRLVHMLSVALDLKIDTGRITELDWQRETLLEILIRIFCSKLTEAVRRGMPRRYIDCEDDLSALRGTLDIHRQFMGLRQCRGVLSLRRLIGEKALDQFRRRQAFRVDRPQAKRLDHLRRFERRRYF